MIVGKVITTNMIKITTSYLDQLSRFVILCIVRQVIISLMMELTQKMIIVKLKQWKTSLHIYITEASLLITMETKYEVPLWKHIRFLICKLFHKRVIWVVGGVIKNTKS